MVNLSRRLHWGSEIRMCPDFKCSKVDRVSNGQVFECHSKTERKNSSFWMGPVFEWSDFGSPLYFIVLELVQLLVLHQGSISWKLGHSANHRDSSIKVGCLAQIALYASKKSFSKVGRRAQISLWNRPLAASAPNYFKVFHFVAWACWAKVAQ